MKLHASALSTEHANRELKQLSSIGLVMAVIGLATFWFLGVIAIGLGARALALSFDKRLAKKPELVGFRALAVGAIVIGIFDLIGGIALAL